MLLTHVLGDGQVLLHVVDGLVQPAQAPEGAAQSGEHRAAEFEAACPDLEEREYPIVSVFKLGKGLVE